MTSVNNNVIVKFFANEFTFGNYNLNLPFIYKMKSFNNKVFN